jgi:hypothetical protein
MLRTALLWLAVVPEELKLAEFAADRATACNKTNFGSAAARSMVGRMCRVEQQGPSHESFRCLTRLVGTTALALVFQQPQGQPSQR